MRWLLKTNIYIFIAFFAIAGNWAQIVAYKTLDLDQTMEGAGSVSRLTNIEGFSTISRLYISSEATADWSSSLRSILLGNGLTGDAWIVLYGNIIHNSYMQIAIPCGLLFAILYFYITGQIYKQHMTKENIAWLLPYFLVASTSTDFFYVIFLALHLCLLCTKSKPETGRHTLLTQANPLQEPANTGTA